MKFIAEKNSLYEAISTASKACAVKTALNILDGVLLNLEGNILTVTGYDLEIGIKISITVDGYEDGNVVTDPRLLSEMVKKMSGDNIEFQLVDNKNIKVISGKSKLSLPCKPGEEFPSIIEIKKETSFNIGERVLKEMFTRVGFCISKINQELECIKIEIEKDVMYTVSTDGNRLAAKKNSPLQFGIALPNLTEENNCLSFSIPEKAINSLIRSLSDETGEHEKIVNISVDKNQISISKENYVLISRLIEGKFVNYRRIMDANFPRALSVNVKELAMSMERCLLLMSEKLKIPVNCMFEENFMKIQCKTSLGTINEEIPISIKEGDFESYVVNFNPRFMLEALQKTNCEEVKISFDNNLKPFKITPLDDNGEFIFIIVPIRSS